MLLMPFVRADNTNGIPRLVKPHHFSQVSKMPTSCGSPERPNRNGKIHEQTPLVFLYDKRFCRVFTQSVYLPSGNFVTKSNIYSVGGPLSCSSPVRFHLVLNKLLTFAFSK